MSTKRVLIGIIVVVAAVGIGLLAGAITGGGLFGTPSPSGAAGESLGPSPSPSAEASIEPSASPSAEPSSVPSSVAPSATPRPTASPGTPAAITVTQLKLDAAKDPNGTDRVLKFQTQGSGTIIANITALSPQGSAVMCLRTASKNLGCKTTASGSMTVKTNASRNDFTLTLRGADIDTPIVELALTFPSDTPTVRIENARFDGTAFPDTNGIQVFITARVDGNMRLAAEWGGHPFLYEIDLIEQGGPGVQTLANQGPATKADVTLPITTPNPWKLLLQNIEDGFGTTPMTVTIGWP